MNDKTTNVRVNFIYSATYNIIAILIPLITTPYLTRTLGAIGLGEYGFAYAVAYYFSLFVKLGLNNYGGREIAVLRGRGEDVSLRFWELFFLQLSLGVIVSNIYILYSCTISNSHTISIIFLLLVISSSFDITWFFWGLEEFKITVMRDFIIKVLTTIGIFLLVKSEQDTWKYALLISGGLLLSQLLLWPSLHKYVVWKRPSINGVVKHIRPNLVLFLPIIALSLYKTMDKVMLGVMTTTEEVGYYHSSESVIQVPIALITSLGTVMQPRMANMVSSKTDPNVIRSVFEKSIFLAMFLSTSIGFGIMTVARDFVPLFFGNGFEKCITLFEILLPSCVFIAFANVIRTQYLIPNKKDKEYVVSLFFGAIINLLFNSILIPYYGSIGTAFGTLLAEASVCIVQSVMTRNVIKTGHLVFLSIPFVISGIVMYVIWNSTSFINDSNLYNLFMKIIFAGATYLIISAILLIIWKYLFKVDVLRGTKQNGKRF